MLNVCTVNWKIFELKIFHKKKFRVKKFHSYGWVKFVAFAATVSSRRRKKVPIPYLFYGRSIVCAYFILRYEIGYVRVQLPFYGFECSKFFEHL